LVPRVWELYPLVAGRPFHPDHEEEIAEAAHALARYHLAAAEYRPPADTPEAVARYTALGFSQATSSRLDDPGLQRDNLLAVRDLAGAPADRQLVPRCVTRVEQVMRDYDGPAYARLAGWVGPGDYTPANLLFSPHGQVVGVFDLDWALPGPRCRDLEVPLLWLEAHWEALATSARRTAN
jgi:Ser/Thr protein kinase RdoA (MazF antagonist)